MGDQIAEHAAPTALRDGVLTVSAESTAWATQLRMVQSQLLAKIAAAVGNRVVSSMRITGPTAPSWRKGPRHISGAARATPTVERTAVSANQCLTLGDPALRTAFQLHDLGDAGVAHRRDRGPRPIAAAAVHRVVTAGSSWEIRSGEIGGLNRDVHGPVDVALGKLLGRANVDDGHPGSASTSANACGSTR